MHSTEAKVIIGLHRIVSDIDRKTAALAAKHNLTFSQFAVLEALYSKGDLTVGQVRESILSSVGTISIIVNNLVKMNYIERLGDEHDRRVCILRLTPEGREVISQLAPENEAMLRNELAVLEQNEKETMVKLLKKLGGQEHGTER